MSHSFGIVIESLVAVLLMLTIGYCMLLNNRLKRLKADEHSLKATIGELITATEIAERAIGGLKHTVRDVNENLGSQLTAATQMSAAAEEPARRRRRYRPAAVQDRDRGPAARRGGAGAGAGRAEGLGGQGGRRGGPSILRTQKGQWSRRMKSFRDIRVIPVVLVAIFGLAVLKVAGLVIDGGYVFDYQPQSTKKSWAQETLNFPGGGKVDAADITGSISRQARGEEGRGAKAGRAAAKWRSRTASWFFPNRTAAGVGVGARHPGAAAGAAAGTGTARA